jgi:plastocyanin
MKQALCSIALAACAALAHAGNLQVSVLGSDGKPAADVVVQAVPSAAWQPLPLPEPVLIAQQNIRFVPFVSVVPVGSTVRFVNRDRFDHHVRSQPGGPLGNVAPAQQFEFRMAASRAFNKDATADIKLETPGIIALGCHLHGSMRGHLMVSSTPWAAVTDDKGRVTLAHVPDGALELRVWHPEQLSDQAPSRLQLAGSQSAEARLNFTPKRRSTAAPPRNPDYPD